MSALTLSLHTAVPGRVDMTGNPLPRNWRA